MWCPSLVGHRLAIMKADVKMGWRSRPYFVKDQKPIVLQIWGWDENEWNWVVPFFKNLLWWKFYVCIKQFQIQSKKMFIANPTRTIKGKSINWKTSLCNFQFGRRFKKQFSKLSNFVILIFRTIYFCYFDFRCYSFCHFDS